MIFVYPPTPSGVNRRVRLLVNGNVWGRSKGDFRRGGGGGTSPCRGNSPPPFKGTSADPGRGQQACGIPSIPLKQPTIYTYYMKTGKYQNWFEKKDLEFLSTGFDTEFSGGSF